jgi:hypothetical protein
MTVKFRVTNIAMHGDKCIVNAQQVLTGADGKVLAAQPGPLATLQTLPMSVAEAAEFAVGTTFSISVSQDPRS